MQLPNIGSKNVNKMDLYRTIYDKLKVWKEKSGRMPLLLQGARQTGKTYAMKRFGELNFEYVAYFNFDKDEDLGSLFDNTKSPGRLINLLTLHTDVPILPGKTLLIFDEIQESNKALNSLKYFSEEAPEYAVIAAGSLLGVALSKGDSFPVGKVEFMTLYPLSFREYLAVVDAKMHTFLDMWEQPDLLPQALFNRLSEFYRQYLVTGGMPAVVVSYLSGQGMEQVELLLQNILNAYALDFSKHVESRDIPRITDIWNSIPSQLSRENRKFLYKLVKPGARAREYEDALLWLQHAGLVYRVFANQKPFLPISAYDDLSAFKIYLSDVGLLRRLAQLPSEAIFSGSPIYTEFKGAVAENYVLTSLISQFPVMPRYWTSVGKAEVDFVLQNQGEIIPIEVKAETRLGGKSLQVYDALYHPDIRIRYSLNNLKQDGNLINIPLFLVDWTHLILKQTKQQ